MGGTHFQWNTSQITSQTTFYESQVNEVTSAGKIDYLQGNKSSEKLLDNFL